MLRMVIKFNIEDSETANFCRGFVTFEVLKIVGTREHYI